MIRVGYSCWSFLLAFFQGPHALVLYPFGFRFVCLKLWSSEVRENRTRLIDALIFPSLPSLLTPPMARMGGCFPSA